MKPRHITFIAAIAMALMPLQAQVRQQGEVVLQNSGRQPLAGVQVRAMGAVPATSDAAGRFDLHFSKSRPGQLLMLDDVYKDGYELVNEEALKQWTVSQSSILPIVMCHKGALAAAQEKYYEIGRSHNMARYADACRQLDEQLAQNILTEQQYNARLDKLSADYVKAMEHLEAYAYALACYNRDDLDQMSINALALVEQGRVDEALEKYRDAQLGKLLQGLDFRQDRERREMETMIPSLRLNADLCCFAGGEDNLQRAGEIYHSIALSDTTNAAYAADYAQFLINNTLQYDKADKWLHLALRHSTDSLQQAELYSKIGLICTYSSEKIQASPEYLQKSKTIYENLSQQDSYSNDAHFNISYADLFINMSQYWILQPDIYEGATNASDLLYEGFGYARKAVELQPGKYVYKYMELFKHYAISLHEFDAYDPGMKTQESLDAITSLLHSAIDISKSADKKDRIKTIQCLVDCYGLLAITHTNWRQLDKGDKYTDTCLALIDNYKHLNPVLFENQRLHYALNKGFYFMQKKDHVAADSILMNIFQAAKEIPYADQIAYNAIYQLASNSILMSQLSSSLYEKGLSRTQMALDYMHSHSYGLTSERKFLIYLSYSVIRAFKGHELVSCESVTLEMLNFMLDNNKHGRLYNDELLAQIISIINAIYDNGNRTISDNSTKQQLCETAIKIIDTSAGPENKKILRQIIEHIWSNENIE